MSKTAISKISDQLICDCIKNIQWSGMKSLFIYNNIIDKKLQATPIQRLKESKKGETLIHVANIWNLR